MGLVTETSTKGTYVFASLEKLSLGSEGYPIRTKLPLMTDSGEPEPIEVRQAAVKIEVLQRSPERSKFNILLAPRLCSDDATQHLCDTTPAIGSGWIKRGGSPDGTVKDTTLFRLEQGWAMLWSNPSGTYVETDWVIGGTTGSSIIAEVVDADTQRIYFLEGAELKLWCKLNNSLLSTADKTKLNHYLEVTTSGGVCSYGSGWQLIADDAAADKLAKQAENMATAAGKK
jgi:hypothetical protein